MIFKQYDKNLGVLRSGNKKATMPALRPIEQKVDEK